MISNSDWSDTYRPAPYNYIPKQTLISSQGASVSSSQRIFVTLINVFKNFTANDLAFYKKIISILSGAPVALEIFLQ